MMKAFVLCVFFAVAAPGCFPPVLTPAQLTERGTRRYANVRREKATEAAATALATLGYVVTVEDRASGVVKTAPLKILSTMTITDGEGSATTTEDRLAWILTVEASGPDVVVHAVPRGFRNGSELHDANMWQAEVMNAKFQDLWREIDETLRMGPPAKANL